MWKWFGIVGVVAIICLIGAAIVFPFFGLMIYAFFWGIYADFLDARREMEQSRLAHEFPRQFEAIPADMHMPAALVLDNGVVLAADIPHTRWVNSPWNDYSSRGEQDPERQKRGSGAWDFILRADVDADALPPEFDFWQDKVMQLVEVGGATFYSRIDYFQLLCVSDNRKSMEGRLQECRDKQNFILVAKPITGWGRVFARLAPPRSDAMLTDCRSGENPELLEQLKSTMPDISSGTQQLIHCPYVSWSLQDGNGSLVGLHDSATEILAFWWAEDPHARIENMTPENLTYRITWPGVSAMPVYLGLGFQEDVVWLINHQTGWSITYLRIQHATMQGDISEVYEPVSFPEAFWPD